MHQSTSLRSLQALKSFRSRLGFSLCCVGLGTRDPSVFEYWIACPVLSATPYCIQMPQRWDDYDLPVSSGYVERHSVISAFCWSSIFVQSTRYSCRGVRLLSYYQSVAFQFAQIALVFHSFLIQISLLPPNEI